MGKDGDVIEYPEASISVRSSLVFVSESGAGRRDKSTSPNLSYAVRNEVNECA